MEQYCGKLYPLKKTYFYKEGTMHWKGRNLIKLKTLVSFFLCLFLGYVKLHATHHKLLITGCGRSGTGYMSAILKKSGYDILHERLGKEGLVSWPMAVNYISSSEPSLNDSFEHTFHQVRHPLLVMTSWIHTVNNVRHPEWGFVRQHIPEIRLTDSLMVHCAKYWYYWNLLAEKKAEWRYRIEDLNQIFPEFMLRSGLILNANALKEIPPNYNTWRFASHKLNWDHLEKSLPPDLYQNIRDMTVRYGYSLDE